MSQARLARACACRSRHGISPVNYSSPSSGCQAKCRAPATKMPAWRSSNVLPSEPQKSPPPGCAPKRAAKTSYRARCSQRCRPAPDVRTDRPPRFDGILARAEPQPHCRPADANRVESQALRPAHARETVIRDDAKVQGCSKITDPCMGGAVEGIHPPVPRH